ncbi:MAG: hypothetical protein FJ303_12240 [Planctomycetes bacterium]|nr:hypothetical protein [Planctomycetota bacterium]
MKSPSLWLCAGLVVFAGASDVHAQVMTNAEIERGLRFRGPSYDGEPYTQRYSYGLQTVPIYLGGDARRIWYLDYLDRADRAEKFGYPMPIDPYFSGPPVVHTAPPGRVFVGFGFGIFRRR